MRAGRHSCSRVFLFGALLAGCGDSLSPTGGEDPRTDPADLIVTVFRNTRESGNFPGGPHTQYALWVGGAGQQAPDAGVVIGEKTPVYQRAGGRLVPTGAATIRVGHVVEVWRDRHVGFGAVQAPPGRPSYTAVQVVIRPD
jgi:hypothetical protein